MRNNQEIIQCKIQDFKAGKLAEELAVSSIEWGFNCGWFGTDFEHLTNNIQAKGSHGSNVCKNNPRVCEF